MSYDEHGTAPHRLLGRLRPSHGHATIEDGQGRWWRNLRFSYWWHFGGHHVEKVVASGHRVIHEPVPRWNVMVGAELVHGVKYGEYLSVGGKLSLTGEETVDIHYSLGRLVHHFWKLDVEHNGRHVNLPLPIRITGRFGPTLIQWCIGRDKDTHFDHTVSRWERIRSNRLQPLRFDWQHMEVRTLVEDAIVIPLPEGTEVPATAKLERRTWRARIGPYRLGRNSKRRFSIPLPWLTRAHVGYNVDITRGVPIPGNLDSDFYDGDDRVYGQSGPFRYMSAHNDTPPRNWQQRVVAEMLTSIMADRLKRGHDIKFTRRESSA